MQQFETFEGFTKGKIGEIKKAVQKGRQIATLKRGAIHNLTGTFAFLSDGEGDLFEYFTRAVQNYIVMHYVPFII